MQFSLPAEGFNSEWTGYLSLADQPAMLKYGSNCLLLYALFLEFDIDDIELIAGESLTDSSDDKKCDLIYVNRDEKTAIIAQGTLSARFKNEAKSNKAGDLNIASSWLFSRSLSDLPENIEPAARDLLEGLADGKIEKISFWFVHNSLESKNCQDELDTVATAARKMLAGKFPAGTNLTVEAKEIGLRRIQKLYNSISEQILVDKEFEIPISGGYELMSDEYSSYSAAVQGIWLKELFTEHKEDLFSANIRSYLGHRQSDLNINNNIRSTALEQPKNFWAFNNGITALVRSFSELEKGGEKYLKVQGISIVNGAQTTGAIGTIKDLISENIFVPARFIKSNSKQIVFDIIRFNNSQNKVAAADFRSIDEHQERLRSEFKEIKSHVYNGGRRGGADEKIKRPQNLITADIAGQILASFHKEAHSAYHDKSQLWESNLLYSKYFNENTHVGHLLFAYALYEQIKKYQTLLKEKHDIDRGLPENELENYIFLKRKGAIWIFMAAIGSNIEKIINKPVPNHLGIRFKNWKTESSDDFVQMMDDWMPIVESAMSMNSYLKPSVEDGLKKKDLIQSCLTNFSQAYGAVGVYLKVKWNEFAEKVEY